MTTQKAQYSPAYDEQIQQIDRDLREQNRRWPTFAAVVVLLGGIALLLLLGKNFDFPDRRTRTGLGTLLVVLFVLWEIRAYRKAKRFAAGFYGEMLPAVLKRAYAAYAPRTGEPDPLLFDPAETWRFPTTVTFLTLSVNDSSFRAQKVYPDRVRSGVASRTSFRAQGVYRIQRQYFKADCLGDKDNDESGQYRVSQNLIWRVQTQEHIPFCLSLHTASGSVSEAAAGVFGKICDRLLKNGMQDVKAGRAEFDRSFRIRADDMTQAELFLNTHGQQLTELRDNMGRFSLEYADDMLTLSFSDFAPIDTKDTNGVRRTGLPNELSAERIAESTQKLDFLSDWLRAFWKKEEGT